MYIMHKNTQWFYDQVHCACWWIKEPEQQRQKI
jgi:hypothetical protein